MRKSLAKALHQLRFYSAQLESSIPAAKQKYVPTTGTYPKVGTIPGEKLPFFGHISTAQCDVSRDCEVAWPFTVSLSTQCKAKSLFFFF